MFKKILLIAFIFISKDNCTQLSYVIRHIQEIDTVQLQECYKAVATKSPNLAAHPDEITNEYISDLVTASMKGLGLVVEFDGKLIGYMLKQKYPYRSCRHILYGGSIGVHPDFQGHGIGTQLISQFLHEVETHYKDILRVEIYALESNPAYRLYQRLGFETEGIIQKGKLYSDGRLESYYSMVWFNPNFDA